jgi:hypothetical protein
MNCKFSQGEEATISMWTSLSRPRGMMEIGMDSAAGVDVALEHAGHSRTSGLDLRLRCILDTFILIPARAVR